jgi:hypothetical protein
MQKTLWVAVKIFLSLLRESSAICKAISRKSAETVSFFYSVLWLMKFTESFFCKCARIHAKDAPT